MLSSRAPKVVPSNKNGSRLTGFISAGDDQQGAGRGDQPQESRGPGDQIHHRLLAGQRALPVDQEADVLVQAAAEARRGGTAEDADHRLALEVGAGLAAHPLGPALRLRDARAGLNRHRRRQHQIDQHRNEQHQRHPPVDDEQVDQHRERRDHRARPHPGWHG